MKKVYAVTTHRKGRDTTYVGTLDYLLDKVFGYTVECNGGCPENIRSLKGLLSNLNGGQSYWSMNTYYDGRPATKEEIEKYRIKPYR